MSTKTTKKVTAQVKETKKEFNLEQAITLWIYKGKKGGKYLSGKAQYDGFKVKGFFNKEKKNPKEPDIRIYISADNGDLSKEEYCSLWCNVSEASGKKYLSGKLGEDCVVGFFNDKAEIGGTIPYINVYFSEDEQDEQVKAGIKEPTKTTKKTQKVEPEYQEVEDDELPF